MPSENKAAPIDRASDFATRTRLGVMMFLSMIGVLACSKDSASPDTASPTQVEDLLAIAASSSRVRLTWTAPEENESPGRASRYEVRFATENLFGTIPWETAGTLLDSISVPSEAGTLEEWFVRELAPGTPYYFALRAADVAGNWSELSNVAEDETLGGDNTPPAAIVSLGTQGLPTSTRVTLAWIAPGDDGDEGRASGYEIRQSPDSLTQSNWDTTGAIIAEPAPKPPGEFEALGIEGLTPQTTYFFAIRTVDEVGNWSDLSNLLLVQTRPEDEAPPAAVEDLAGRLLGPRDVELTWTAPGDDGTLGQASRYDLRYAEDPQDLIDHWDKLTVVETKAPLTSGSRETVLLNDLSKRTTFFFGVYTYDDAELRSEFSNIATMQTSDSTCIVLPDGNGDFESISAATSLGAGCIIELGDGIFTGGPNRDWGDGAQVTIRSASGLRNQCVIDFEGEPGTFPAGTRLENVTLKNASQISVSADPVTGEALQATHVLFDQVSLLGTGQSKAGTILDFVSCEITGTTDGVFVDAGVVRFKNCQIRENETGIAIGYDVSLEDCLVANNRGEVPLVRAFVDLGQASGVSLLRNFCQGNEARILEPKNVEMSLQDCIFTDNQGGIMAVNEQSHVAVTRCSFVANHNDFGTCVVFERRGKGSPSLSFVQCILAANTGGALFAGDLSAGLTLSCSDVFGNAAGDYVGTLSPFAEKFGNISADPLFCGASRADFGLRETSPCSAASQPECGRIGGADVECP